MGNSSPLLVLELLAWVVVIGIGTTRGGWDEINSGSFSTCRCICSTRPVTKPVWMLASSNFFEMVTISPPILFELPRGNFATLARRTLQFPPAYGQGFGGVAQIPPSNSHSGFSTLRVPCLFSEKNERCQLGWIPKLGALGTIFGYFFPLPPLIVPTVAPCFYFFPK